MDELPDGFGPNIPNVNIIGDIASEFELRHHVQAEDVDEASQHQLSIIPRIIINDHLRDFAYILNRWIRLQAPNPPLTVRNLFLNNPYLRDYVEAFYTGNDMNQFDTFGVITTDTVNEDGLVTTETVEGVRVTYRRIFTFGIAGVQTAFVQYLAYNGIDDDDPFRVDVGMNYDYVGEYIPDFNFQNLDGVNIIM